MAIYSEKYIDAGSGHELFVRQWVPEGEIKGLVQVCHGMAEHGARYKKLGEFLSGHGYAVFCHDHRGHGKTCLPGETLGFFAEKDGWDKIVNDASCLGELMRSQFPQGKFFLFGHSMGSLVVSDMAELQKETPCDGFILCGSPSPNPMVSAGKAMANMFCALGMSRKPNKFISSIAFAGSNKGFPQDKSENAWLSSDTEQVEKYDADPLCGFCFTSAAFRDMFEGLSRVRSKGWAIKTKCAPYLVISGDKDPVGNNGQSVRWIGEQMKAAGRSCKCILYPGMRHEILNEKNCNKVYTDILDWIIKEEQHG